MPDEVPVYPSPADPPHADPQPAGPTPAGTARAAAGRGAVETLLAQLADDERHYAPELIEILVSSHAVRSSADYRILQAASLLHEEREADYLERVHQVVGDGRFTDPAELEAHVRGLVREGITPQERYGPDGLEAAICEVGAALTVAPGRAREIIIAGSVMRYRLPDVGLALAIGRIDLQRMLDVVARTSLVDDGHIADLDTALSEAIMSREPMSTTRFRTMIDATIAAIDPDALVRRRRSVEEDRHISIRPDRATFGQSRVSGSVASEAAAAVDSRLDAMAAAVHTKGDGRTKKQLRADALLALARGEQSIACTCDECRATPTAAGPEIAPTGIAAQPVTPAPRPTFHIVVNLSTLLCLDETPGFIDGQGLIDAATARDLLREAKRSYINPGHEEQARQAFTYEVPRKLRALVSAGELCCTFPGCTNPAWRSDMDHTEPFDHRNPAAGGTTTRRNIKPLCRIHHRAKTHGVGWQDRQTALGEVFFRTPGGYVFAGNSFTGSDLFTSLRMGEKPPDHPGRRRIDSLRARRAAKITRIAERAEETWNRENPPPF